MRTTSNAFRLTYLAILTALVIVLQLLGNIIPSGPFKITFVLLPIVLGVVTSGPLAGGWLGFVFGVSVLLFSPDVQAFWAVNIFGTIVTVVLKGVLCGLVAGYVFHLLKNKNKYLAVIVAAIVCPIVNTGVFVLGTLVFFWDTLSMWAVGAGSSAWAYLIFVMIGINFIIELLYNIVFAPTVVRLMSAAKLERFLK